MKGDFVGPVKGPRVGEILCVGGRTLEVVENTGKKIRLRPYVETRESDSVSPRSADQMTKGA